VGDPHQVSVLVFGHLFERLGVLLGKDQDMAGLDGVDIHDY
jgi:hypothetical protein